MLIALVLICLIILYRKREKEYKNGAYYTTTRHPYHYVRFDKGRYGEYLIYKNLQKFETIGARFLFNVYIPKVTGGTTELDVLMICPKGIFVFESKNFSGWIFGKESQKTGARLYLRVEDEAKR